MLRPPPVGHPTYRWLGLGLMLILLLSPLLYWLTGIGQTAGGLSAEIVRAPDDTLLNSPKAEALHSLSSPMRLQRLFVGPLLLLAFQLSGGAIALRNRLERGTQTLSGHPTQEKTSISRFVLNVLGWTQRFIPNAWRQRLTRQELAIILSFIVVFDLALLLLYLPLNFYRSFIVAHQFGLSTQTALGWLGDWGKSGLIALFTDALIWGGFYSLVRLFPRRWPVPGGALLFLFGLIFTLLAPLIITPLFFEVRPLDDLNLRERVFTLAERANMPVDDLYVVDASSKTTQINAYVAGFGDAQRMVLYDNLIIDYTFDQIDVVLAHELGHWYYRHVLLGVIGLGAAGWLGLFGLQWLLNRSWPILKLRGFDDVAGLPYLMAVVTIVATLSLPVQNIISRYAENQADIFALTVSQNPEAFVALFEQVAEQNLSLVNPPAWEVFVFYTHPPTAQRIDHAESSR